MAFFGSILIALIGAAMLGFICAWYLQARNLIAASAKAKELDVQLAGKQAEIDQLKLDGEAHKASVENLQKQLQSVENEVIKMQSEIRVLEGENKVLEREKLKLVMENTQLEFEVKNNIKEIEVIREIPVYVSEEKPADIQPDGEETEKQESANSLLKAFQKGVEENENNPIV